jgi:hypothetical protein
MVVSPGIEVKSIERDSTIADRDHDQVWTHLHVEAIPIHPQIARSVAVAEQPRKQIHDLDRLIGARIHGPAAALRGAVLLPGPIEIRSLKDPCGPAGHRRRQPRPDVLLERASLEAEIRHGLGARVTTLVSLIHH